MAKVSKNSRVGQRAANQGSGRDMVKVVKSIKNPISIKTKERKFSTINAIIIPIIEKNIVKHIIIKNIYQGTET